ncbi:MAG: hypothetical protein H0X30_00770 [Anaerolineae bacterium]|nr:hypothetical protein [Anaerolineae bacterium]
MFIQGNMLGLTMFITCGLVAIASILLKIPDAVGLIGLGLALFLMDIIVRLRSRTLPNWLMSKEVGGYLYFIPAWIGGFVIIGINLISALSPK